MQVKTLKLQDLQGWAWVWFHGARSAPRSVLQQHRSQTAAGCIGICCVAFCCLILRIGATSPTRSETVSGSPVFPAGGSVPGMALASLIPQCRLRSVHGVAWCVTHSLWSGGAWIWIPARCVTEAGLLPSLKPGCGWVWLMEGEKRSEGKRMGRGVGGRQRKSPVLRPECLLLNLCVDSYTPQSGIQRWGCWEVIRTGGWNPSEWDECLYKRYLLPFAMWGDSWMLCLNQEVGSPDIESPCSLILDFQVPELWAIIFCDLQATQCVVFCYSSLSRLRY